MQASQTRLTDAERRIGTVLLNDSQSAPLLTAAQLAKQADVHESTVVRFAQKLGYAGYIALRLDLASDTSNGPRRRPQPSGEEASLARVVRAQTEVLERLEENVPQAEVDGAMAAVLAGGHHYVLGDGLVGPVAEFFGRKVAILGLPVSVVRQSGVELVVQLAMVRPGDVVTAFTLSTEYAANRAVFDSIRERGATLILITDQPIHTHKPEADFLLAVPRSDLNHGVFVALSAVAYALDYSLMLQLKQRG
nr:MurR/RpiR family transcriptional regulator [Agrococcus sp. ARC_14]